jgi:hypothetical protein
MIDGTAQPEAVTGSNTERRLFPFGLVRSVFFRIGRRRQTMGPPVAVDNVTIRIAPSEAIRHACRPLQAAYHGDNVNLTARRVFFGGVFPGPLVGLAAGTIGLVLWNTRSMLIHLRWLLWG